MLKSAKTLNWEVRSDPHRTAARSSSTTPVIKTDINASNGVIHVVNRVLIPPAR